MTKSGSELAQRVAGHSFWWHRIDLGQGVVTPGLDDSPTKLQQLKLPTRMDGLTVLDIGAWDGFFSFECERRGARRVVASDWVCWQDNKKGGFDIARQALNSNVEEYVCKVEDLTPEALGGPFDIVLFLGVLYHSEDPMRYLRVVRSLCKGLVVVETRVDGMDYPRPAMIFYPGSTLNNDPTNFWGPNALAVEAMLHEVGFSRVNRVAEYYGTRMVFHATV